ncbi:MAG: 16S rRNA (cytosine(1402)-N(4))-methyltransferase, partial [Deltaproteobacteria bacterium]|nr:16S rRNA (cytosine(1402)-N(4))-methyltransferase [Deltaproteobacteria bacterium]
LLTPKGRLCILSFHSLEDRIVKHRLKALEKSCVCPPDFPQCVCDQKSVIRILTKKIVRPTKDEIARNPMSRSTKLRAAEKI